MKIFWGIPAVVATAALAWNSPTARAGHCGCTTYPAVSGPVCDNQTGFASALARLRPSTLLGNVGANLGGGPARDANGTIAGYDTVTETRMTTAYQSVNETVMKPVTRTVLKDEARTSYKTVTETECKTVTETVNKPVTTTAGISPNWCRPASMANKKNGRSTSRVLVNTWAKLNGLLMGNGSATSESFS